MEFQYDFDFTEVDWEDNRHGIIWKHVDPTPIFDWCETTFGPKGGRWTFTDVPKTQPWAPGINMSYLNNGTFGFHSAGDHLLFSLYMSGKYRLEPR